MMRRTAVKRVLCGLALAGLLAVTAASPRPEAGVVVTGRLTTRGESGPVSRRGRLNAVVWLTPLGAAGRPAANRDTGTTLRRFRLNQKNKRFDPHLMVVPVGAVVDFPNADPLFHNVFSLFDGKRFDLGLYESGATRAVAFDRQGICYIFCNIHPDMSAVVVVLDTPYYAMPDEAGTVTIPNVPPGRYELRVWNERSAPQTLRRLTREATIAPDSASLGTIVLEEAEVLPLTHKNKYGREYDSPAPPGELYRQP